jgi:oxygen-dependent protoporphyrinogen oxidase
VYDGQTVAVSSAYVHQIHLLDLSTSLIVTPKTSPAAKNRFLYLAPSDNQAPSGLVQLPSSIASLVRSPIGRKLLLPAVVAEPFRLQNRSRDLHGQVAEDESFDAFCTRRFGARFARAMGSALVHGIYAADSRKLSVRAAFPSLWNSERRGRGSVVRGMLRGMFDPPTATTSQAGKYELGAVKEALRDASVFSFRNGLEEITNALLARLKQQTNVRILTRTGVQSVTYDKLLHEFAV